jgi:hypothetical protein
MRSLVFSAAVGCVGALACCGGPPSGASDTEAGTVGGATGLVAQCEALATTFVNQCNNEYSGDAHTPDTGRVCIWTAYRAMCQTGNTQLLVDSMNCFGANPHCWTFSDPNDTATCLARVHATEESAAARAFLQTLCTTCGSAGCPMVGQAEVVPYLSDAKIAQLNGCWGGNCTTAGLVSMCSAIPELALFNCH